MSKIFTLLQFTTILVVGISSERVHANCDVDSNGDAECAGTFYANGNGTWGIVPDVQKLAVNIPSIDGLEWQQAIAVAASTWNESTNARSYRVQATANSPSLWPIDFNDCTSSQLSKVQVIALDNTEDQDPGSSFDLCGGSRACAVGRCKRFDSALGRNVSYAATVIVMKRLNGTTGNISWSVGGPTFGSFDLASTLTHELGHVANLTHPVSAAATMGAGATDETRRRDLYE